MQLIQTVLTGVLASCAVAPAARMQLEPTPADLLGLPPAKGPLAISADSEGGPSMGQLLHDFGQLTGVSLTASPAVMTALAQQTVGMLGPVQIQPAEVYSFVESLLLDHGFLMAVLHADEPRMLGVYQVNRNAGLIMPATNVPADQAERFAEHPAILMRTLLELDAVEVVAFGNSLRPLAGMVPGAAVLPLGGSSALLVEGPGRWVADVASLAKLANARERERDAAERQRRQEEDQRRREEQERRRQQEGEKAPPGK